MKTNKYYDPYEDLEKQVLNDLQHATNKLGGTMKKSVQNYRGRISKVVTIEYDVHDMT